MSTDSVLNDHDLLAGLKLLAAGRDVAFTAAALNLDEQVLLAAAEDHGHPDRDRLAIAVDVVQQRLDSDNMPADEAPRPHPREHAARAAGATLARDGDDVAPPPVTMLPLTSLVGHAQNIRQDVADVRDLAASIQANGLLQPITVTKHPTRTGKWLILAGHRRTAAANRVPGLTRIPAIIREPGHLVDHLVVMLVENHQRRNLTPVEKAEALGKLRDRGLNQTQIARRTGINVSSVNSFLALLDLDAASMEQVRAGTLTAGDAIGQVKKVRAAERRQAGTPARGRPVVAKVQHFTRLHPLAETARDRCDHTTLPKLGGIACGPCWEQTIRDDVTAAATR